MKQVFIAVRNFRASSNQSVLSALFDAAMIWVISRYSISRLKSFAYKEWDKRYSTHTLLSHHMVPYYIIGIYSFLRFLQRVPKIVVYDDGTMTPEDYTLLSCVPRIRIITYEEGNIKASVVLGAHSILLSERIISVYNRKLIDHLLFPQKETMSLLMDPDILFFRYPGFLDSFLSGDTDTDLIYMQDVQNAYIAPITVLQRVFKTRVVPKLNSGLIGIRSASLTTSDVQDYYSILRKVFNRKPLFDPWVEQTGYAVIASRLHTTPMPENYQVGPSASGGSVCTHYVHGMRGSYSRGLLHMLSSERTGV